MSDAVHSGGCYVPPQLLHDDDLSNGEKVLFGRILSLSQKDGYCYASNEYLADEIGVSKRSIRNYLGSLLEKEYIRREVDEYEQGTERRLFPTLRQGGGSEFPQGAEASFHQSTRERESKEQTSCSNEVEKIDSFSDKQGHVVGRLEEVPSLNDAQQHWSLAGKWINDYGFDLTRKVMRKLINSNKLEGFNQQEAISYIVGSLEGMYEEQQDEDDRSFDDKWEDLANE